MSTIVENKKWDNLPSAFKEVKLDKMDGKNLLGKVIIRDKENTEGSENKRWL